MSPRTCTARTTIGTGRSAVSSSGSACASADGGEVVCGPDVERELFLATVGGMGLTALIVEVTFRLQPRRDPVDGRRDRGPARSGRDAGGPRGERAGLAVHRGLDRLPRARQRYRAGRADPRAPRPGGRGGRAAAAGPARPRRADRCAGVAPESRRSSGSSTASTTGPRAPGAGRGGSPTSGSSIRSTRSATGTGSTGRAASCSTSACCRARRGAPPSARSSSALAAAGAASFLAVIKDCGPASEAYLSFPIEGTTLALDLPYRGAATEALVHELDACVIASGGPHLSREGRGDARRGLRAHDAAARRVEGRARPLGSGAPLSLRAVRAGPRGSRVKAVVVGATRGMGRALARALAERGDALWLLGREASAELAASARDLEARGARGRRWRRPRSTSRVPAGFADALDAADRGLGGFDTLVVTGGLFGRQEDLAVDPVRLERLLHVNFTGTVVLCQMVAERLAARGGGTICAFSSVAGRPGAAQQLSLRRLQGRPLRLPRGARPGLCRPRRARGLRQAGLRQDGDDRGPARAAVRGGAGRGRPGPCSAAMERGRPSSTPPASGAGHARHPRSLPRA